VVVSARFEVDHEDNINLTCHVPHEMSLSFTDGVGDDTKSAWHMRREISIVVTVFRDDPERAYG